MIYPELPKSVRIAIVIAVVCASTIVIVHGMFHGGSGLSDFAGYYTASSIAARGDSTERMYDDTWFVRKIGALGLTDTTMIMYVNPPPVALVMVPLVRFEPRTAKLIWNFLSLIIAGGVIAAGIRLFRIPRNAGYVALFAGLILATVPMMRNLQRGQLYVAMLFFIFLFLQGLIGRNAWLTGISLGGLLVLKYFGWIFFLLLLVSRRWKEAAITIAVSAVVVALMTLWFGPALYAAHLQRLVAAFSSPDLAITHLPAIPPFFGGFFTLDPLYNPNPVFDAPWLARILTIATIGGLLWGTFAYYLKDPARRLDRAFSAVLVVSVIATPLAAEHHYLLLVPAFWHYLFISRQSTDITNLVSFAFLGYLLFGWFPQSSFPFTAWYAQLSAYPHLLGAILLWTGLIYPQPESKHA